MDFVENWLLGHSGVLVRNGLLDRSFLAHAGRRWMLKEAFLQRIDRVVAGLIANYACLSHRVILGHHLSR